MSADEEFLAWPKIARLNRDIVVTEKIDGTNAAIVVSDDGNELYCQSRKRVITPGDDNFGFARWADDRKEVLSAILGPGRHYGEWWGSGIQRGYGLAKGEKRFSLFNASRWGGFEEDGLTESLGLCVVPTLYEGPFSESKINGCLNLLRGVGSFAVPGFLDPEGVVVYHTAANQMFKVTLKDDEQPKGLVSA